MEIKKIESAAEKLTQINDQVTNICGDEKLFEEMLESGLVSIEVPTVTKNKDDSYGMGFVISNSGHGSFSGISVKPGNIKLHLKRAIVGAQGVTAAAGKLAKDGGMGAVFGAIAIAAYLADVFVEKIPKKEAYVLVAVDEICKKGSISVEKAYEYFKRRYEDRLDNSLSFDDYSKIIDYLCDIGCLSANDGQITVEEEIIHGY